MLLFMIIEDGEEIGFECEDDCPAKDFFGSNPKRLEGPDIYDDYFRQYAPEQEWSEQKRKGITTLSGAKIIEFWEFLMDMAVYTGDAIFGEGLIQQYEEAKATIREMSNSGMRKRAKARLLERLGVVHTRLRNPGDKKDSLESFGAFVHLLIAGCTDFIDKDVKIMIVQEGDPNTEDDLQPFLDHFESMEDKDS